MQPRTLAGRVEILEQKMEGLEGLPDRGASLDGRVALLDERVASLTEQFSQFRVETRMEFSAVRGEMRGMREELIARIEAVDGAVGATRTEMREMRTELIARIEAVDGAAGENSNSDARAAREGHRAHRAAGRALERSEPCPASSPRAGTPSFQEGTVNVRPLPRGGPRTATRAAAARS